MFFKVKTTEEVLDLVREFSPAGEVTVSIEDALGLALSGDISAPDNLPGFHRSSMDGFAVIAKDTFGASESIPAFLELAGEVAMGLKPDVSATQGKAIKISTGGMLPEGCDAVVMLEYCHSLDETTIEVSRAVSPLENVICPDDDFKENAVVFKAGTKLRPQDIGLLAGLGISEVSVFRRPKVAIISTGDEIVTIDKTPGPGQVRDINSYTLSTFCRQLGGEPTVMGLCRDNFSELKSLMEKSLECADTVWVSGGSSVGVRDMTLKVLESISDMELLVHGISISPGKPTIIAKTGNKAVFGLPGHAASAMVIAEVFLREFLAKLLGHESDDLDQVKSVKAVLDRNVESKSGRDDFIRVRLEKENDSLKAVPVFGKSGLISTLVEAHGLVRIDRNSEGIYQGQTVEVILFNR